MIAQSSFHQVVQLYRSDEDNMRAQTPPALLHNQAATIREVLYQTRPGNGFFPSCVSDVIKAVTFQSDSILHNTYMKMLVA